MTALLRAEGISVNRKRVKRLMRRMGIEALGPKPRTTKPAPGHKYLNARPGDRPAEPRVGGGYHLCARRPRLSLPGGDRRLGEPGSAGVAPIEHDGCRVDALDEALVRFTPVS
jgi:transposase InsO family protein